MIEYVTNPVLTDITKRHNMQFPLKMNQEVLCTLIACHLSYEDCANSDADGCGQVIIPTLPRKLKQKKPSTRHLTRPLHQLSAPLDPPPKRPATRKLLIND